jgi:hypothetical protein
VKKLIADLKLVAAEARVEFEQKKTSPTMQLADMKLVMESVFDEYSSAIQQAVVRGLKANGTPLPRLIKSLCTVIANLRQNVKLALCGHARTQGEIRDLVPSSCFESVLECQLRPQGNWHALSTLATIVDGGRRQMETIRDRLEAFRQSLHNLPPPPDIKDDLVVSEVSVDRPWQPVGRKLFHILKWLSEEIDREPRAKTSTKFRWQQRIIDAWIAYVGDINSGPFARNARRIDDLQPRGFEAILKRRMGTPLDDDPWSVERFRNRTVTGITRLEEYSES